MEHCLLPELDVGEWIVFQGKYKYIQYDELDVNCSLER